MSRKKDTEKRGVADLVGPDPFDGGAATEPAAQNDIKKMVAERVAQAEGDSSPAAAIPEITSQFIHECLFANTLGDGTLYATMFRDRFLHCKHTQEWYEWTGHVWQHDIMNRSLAAVDQIAQRYLGEYKKLAQTVADLVYKGDEGNQDEIKKLRRKEKDLLNRVQKLRDDNRRTACLKFSHTIDNPLAISGEEFDQKPMLFPCPNGVIDLETGRIRPGKQSDYLSLSTPVEFRGIDEPAPLWEKTLQEIFNADEEIYAYIQRLFGYAMTGYVHEKAFPVLYGRNGWNGRSLIVETISHVMGTFARSIPSEMLLSSKYVKDASGPSPDIMSLKGLRMAFATETDEGHRFNSAKVKKLTGNDELVGRNPNDKYQSYFQPTHKLFLMTNVTPSAPPNDKAFWARLHLIPFNISFVNRDPQESYERRAILDLDRRLLAEAPGILSWLVRGCLLWQKEGLNPPLIITEATEKYRQDEDLVADFIDECCVREAGAKESSSAIYDRFIEWYHANVGKKEPSGTWLGKQLGQKYEKSKSNGRYVYHGIRLLMTGEG